ncbi:oligo-1,6-glucosidase [Hydrogenispora ethanolica]|jgi:oligo-1,6-glucosidase|uniref:Oligo-1,6-glucosidase n=1 Tax=Hydrogenispora ethanolica TaxID=1082276 RepID=A0A4R1RB96_HYDET|nr:alpha-glucosidase [Hydrogenispora ethanolica]TCL62722.1 oligo-1,6-glucosidase [Hydrogenispora ethanolica]
MKKTWWKESVVYQIYPRSFKDGNGDGSGDLRGIAAKLDYLQWLGVDVLWLCPIFQSPNDDNGYDISDYRAIMAEFGTMADFDELLAQAHRRGLKILLDLVVNHSSDEHAWFVESRKSRDNPYRDFYIWKEGKNGQEPNNWGSAFGGSAWQYDPATAMYYLHCFSKKQPDLNWDNPAVRREVQDIVRWWLDKGVDGFRMDVINLISKDPRFPDGPVAPGKLYADCSLALNGPRVHEYLRELHQNVLSKYDIMTVGETGGVTPAIARDYVAENRAELNMLFHFEHMDLDKDRERLAQKPFRLTELKRILSTWQKDLGDDGWNSLYWNNHDQPRVVSRFGNDQEYWEKSAKMLATCLYLQRGTPYIYQGEEIGMTNMAFETIADYRDIGVLHAYQEEVVQKGRDCQEFLRYQRHFSRDNARTPMQWDDSANAGFSGGTPWIKVNPNYRRINVSAQMTDRESILHYYRRLIKTRKENEVILYGSYDLILADSEEIYAYIRALDKQGLLVVCNFTAQTPLFELPEHIRYSAGQLLIGNYTVTDGPMARFSLRPYECRAYLFSFTEEIYRLK